MVRTFHVLAFRMALVAIAVVCVAGAAAAQPGRGGTVALTGASPNTPIDLNILGIKQASATVSQTGDVSFAVDYATTAKPQGFRGTAYLDTSASGAVLQLVEEGAPPPPLAPGYTRRRLGRAEFGADRNVSFSAARSSAQAPIGGIGGGFAVSTTELKKEAVRERVVATLDGSTIFDEQGGEIDPDFDVEGQLGGVVAPVIIPLKWGTSAASRRSVGRLVGEQTGGGAIGSRLVTHHAILAIGRGQAELDFHNRQTGDRTHWQGNGTQWGIGYGAMLELCKACNWFANASYVYSKLPRTDMTRSPALDFAPIGGQLTRDAGTFTSHTHTFEATVGRATRYVFPYAGVRTSAHSATLEGTVDVTFSTRFGNVLEQTTFTNEFGRTTTLALVGAQVRVPRTNLFVRVEGATDGDSSHLGVNFGYGWYR